MNLSRDPLFQDPKEQYQKAFRLLQAGEIMQAEHCLLPLMDAYPDEFKRQPIDHRLDFSTGTRMQPI